MENKLIDIDFMSRHREMLQRLIDCDCENQKLKLEVDQLKDKNKDLMFLISTLNGR